MCYKYCENHSPVVLMAAALLGVTEFSALKQLVERESQDRINTNFQAAIMVLAKYHPHC